MTKVSFRSKSIVQTREDRQKFPFRQRDTKQRTRTSRFHLQARRKKSAWSKCRRVLPEGVSSLASSSMRSQTKESLKRKCRSRRKRRRSRTTLGTSTCPSRLAGG